MEVEEQRELKRLEEEEKDKVLRAPLQGNDWQCQYCPLMNEPTVKKCEACGFGRRTIAIGFIKMGWDPVKLPMPIQYLHPARGYSLRD